MKTKEAGRWQGGVFAALFMVMVLVPQYTDAASHDEEAVRSFFKDTPVMAEIARCESKFRQFGSDGLALRGGWAGGMVGVFQIYESVHAPAAQALGFDLETLEGNMGYAQHLYAQEGTRPWNSAKSCWQQVAASSERDDVNEAEIEALEKKVKELKKLVAQLQKLIAQRNALL